METKESEEYFSIIMKPYTNDQVKFKIKEVGTYTGTGSGSLIEKYAKNAQAVILAYKRADTETFDELKKAMGKVNKYYSNVFKVVLVDDSDETNKKKKN